MRTAVVGDVLPAVRAGDIAAVAELVRSVSPEAMSGDEGSALLRVADLAGHAEVVSTLINAGADAARAWADGVDPVSWAVDHGAREVLGALLGGGEPWRDDSSERRALRIAQGWLSVDPEQELRRRLGAVGDDTVVVEREVRGTIDDRPGTTRLRVTTRDGRRAETHLTHRAIVTFLERRLGVPVSREELVARALWQAVPGSCDWDESQYAFTCRLDREETFRWAATQVNDPSVHVRRFMIELLHRMSFDEHTFGEQAVEVLRSRLFSEADPIALAECIAGFAEYVTKPADLRDILPHAHHPAPVVRRRVAMQLILATGEPRQGWRYEDASRFFVTPPEVVTALVGLAADADERTRWAALLSLADSGIDTPQVREVMAVHLADDCPDARLEAAVGLVLRDDPRGTDVFWQISASVTDQTASNWARVDSVRRILAARTVG